MRPRGIVYLESTAFQSGLSCLADQLVGLLRAIEALRPDLKRYVADVETLGPSPVARREPAPILMGDTGALVQAAQRVDQFQSGVFAGVPSSMDQPAFRTGGLWTDDEEAADLGDAVVEVRAFDTSYWSIATADVNLAEAILKRLGEEGDK